MISDQYLLSICIPTYNRAAVLKETLENLVSLPAYQDHDDIEVVISDNCSSDETEKVALSFVEHGGGRMRYFKNAQNVCDRNFELALSRGRGEYLKLSNDTLRYDNEGLAFIYKTVNDNKQRKPVLFFTGQTNQEEYRDCTTIDAFLSAVSYLSTWIGGYGIWRDHFAAIEDYSRYASLKLNQVDALLREFEMTGVATCCCRNFCSIASLTAKGGYNVVEVFGKNYAMILGAHLKHGLSRKTMRREKFRVLYSVIIPSIVFPNPCSTCDRSGYVKFLLRDYSCFLTYWLIMPIALLARYVPLKYEYCSRVKCWMDRISVLVHWHVK